MQLPFSNFGVDWSLPSRVVSFMVHRHPWLLHRESFHSKFYLSSRLFLIDVTKDWWLFDHSAIRQPWPAQIVYLSHFALLSDLCSWLLRGYTAMTDTLVLYFALLCWDADRLCCTRRYEFPVTNSVTHHTSVVF